MNRIWGMMGKELEKKISGFKNLEWDTTLANHGENIVYRKRNSVSKEQLDNELKEEIEEIIEKNKGKSYIGRVGREKFTYALLYNLYGYKEEYIRVLNEIEYDILGYTKERCISLQPKCQIYTGLGMNRALRKLHCIIILKQEKFKAFITKDKNIYSQTGDNVRLEFEETTVYDYIYSLMWAYNKDYGGEMKHKNLMMMYYALYLYLHEEENKDEYKKLTLNYAQKIIDDRRIYIMDEYLMLVDLTINYPEVFGDFLDTPHKMVRANEELLRFTKVNPIKELGEEENKIIKKIKKKDIRIFENKPKRIHKWKQFASDLVITKFNSEIIIKQIEEKIKAIELNSDDDSYYDNLKEIQQHYLSMLNEIRNKFYVCYELKEESFVESLVDFENRVNELKSIIIEGAVDTDNEVKFVELGYKLFDLALMYSLVNDEKNAEKYFEECTTYLVGETDEDYFDEPRDYDGTCESFLKNAYANIRLNNLNGIRAALYINPEMDNIEDDEELLEFEVTDSVVLAVYEDVEIEVLIKSIKDMIKMDKVRGDYILYNQRIYESLKNIVEYRKTNNIEKLEITERKLQLLYNQIDEVFNYLEIYPIYFDLKKMLMEVL